MKLTKADRIFQSNYSECRLHIQAWGMEYNPDGTAVGFCNLGTEEVMSPRTFNAIEKLINAEAHRLALEHELGIADERTELNENAIAMMRTTLQNARDLYSKWQ
ncbi:MAG: hypothetical protein IJH11_00290 [Lachnospiraceae bacterium]|nr:hypothetical protein [Lachnospiraceae bacterium]